MRVSSKDASGRAPPIIIGALGVSGLHPLVVNPEGARQSQQSRVHPPEGVNCQGIRKMKARRRLDGGEWEKARHIYL